MAKLRYYGVEMDLVGAVNPLSGNPRILRKNPDCTLLEAGYHVPCVIRSDDGTTYVVVSDYYRGYLPVGKFLKVEVLE